MEEIWLPIKNYEGIYEVSNLGRVRSLTRTILRNGNHNSTFYLTIKGRVLKYKITKLGYCSHGLSNGKKRDMSHFSLHRLVAEAFIPNSNNLPQVHHKDHNKLNNTVDNLMWVTASENVKAAIEVGVHHGGFKRGLKHHIGKLTDEQVLEIRELGKTLKYDEIARMYNISKPHAHTIINRKRRTLI